MLESLPPECGTSGMMRDRDRGCRGFRRRGATRREALRAGMLALPGLGLSGLYRGRAAAAGTVPGAAPAAAAAAGFGRARACILIFQWGGPSQLDTWDPKPDAP